METCGYFSEGGNDMIIDDFDIIVADRLYRQSKRPLQYRNGAMIELDPNLQYSFLMLGMERLLTPEEFGVVYTAMKTALDIGERVKAFRFAGQSGKEHRTRSFGYTVAEVALIDDITDIAVINTDKCIKLLTIKHIDSFYQRCGCFHLFENTRTESEDVNDAVDASVEDLPTKPAGSNQLLADGF